MSHVLARFKRGENRVKIVPDMEPGYHYIVSANLMEPTRVERFQSQYLLLHADMYVAAGYKRLKLCQACEGDGRQWYTDRQGEADKDVCTVCEGEGGR
jgi:hypothetical protein